MYNGRLGVVTDSNGLYYMRARYYNPEIRRFINQDIITGSIENSQSLNRCAYCQGNPVNYLDPFGLSPQSFGSWAGHTVLNLLSFIPVFGNAADAFNAIWYAYEGNYAEAIACAVGAIPLIGNLATGFKIGSKVVKGCNIAANGGKAAIGFYNGVQNVMNVDRMIRTGTGRWYDYLGQGVQFGLNMFVSAVGVSGAWNGISNLVDELNYGKMQKLAQEISWNDIDGGPELDKLLGTGRKFSRTSWTEFEFDLQFFASNTKSGRYTTADIYSFGNKSEPRGARPKQDFGVEDFDSIIGPENGPLPKGASNVLDVNKTLLSGHYHMLPAGTKLPDGLDIIADGIDVMPDSPHCVGHYTIFPTKAMTVNEFNALYKSLPWQYGGKK